MPVQIPPELRSATFTYAPILGGYEPGLTRRDPSPVIRADGTYYVWYTRTPHTPHGYDATIWYATSPDGREWTEQGEALPRGGAGAWDEHSVFTPTILAAEGRYYLFYTGVPEPFTNEGGAQSTPTAIGAAVAEDPAGPWSRLGAEPLLRPGTDEADFDSHRVDDACFVVREGRYWLYYKGRQLGLQPSQTKMGVAVAESPSGPYRKRPENPVLDSGHEVCVWPHREGVAAIVMPSGPQGKTLQYSPDGIQFCRCCGIEPPKAPGPYRADGFASRPWGPGIEWGVSMVAAGVERPYLVRFETDLAAPAAE